MIACTSCVQVERGWVLVAYSLWGTTDSWVEKEWRFCTVYTLNVGGSGGARGVSHSHTWHICQAHLLFHAPLLLPLGHLLGELFSPFTHLFASVPKGIFDPITQCPLKWGGTSEGKRYPIEGNKWRKEVPKGGYVKERDTQLKEISKGKRYLKGENVKERDA